MTAITTNDMKWMRTMQQDHMLDRGRVHKWSEGTRDADGITAAVYTPGPSIKCGYWRNGGGKSKTGGDAPLTPVTVRLPFGTDINQFDRFEVTHRLGVALATTELHEVMEQPEIGPSGIVIRLQLVTNKEA